MDAADFLPENSVLPTRRRYVIDGEPRLVTGPAARPSPFLLYRAIFSSSNDVLRRAISKAPMGALDRRLTAIAQDRRAQDGTFYLG